MRLLISFLVLLLVLLQYRLWFGNGSLTDIHHLTEIKESQLQENAELQERNHSLAAEVIDLKQGLDAIEERARSEMGMIKEDETFFQITGTTTPQL
ncbi:MAG: cell division protein FtsB [Gammaproteobacteria bacterium]|nr:cell division protein FtsB [Gammaproteobacteria bacterium]